MAQVSSSINNYSKIIFHFNFLFLQKFFLELNIYFYDAKFFADFVAVLSNYFLIFEK